jgi:hypothetical protein
MTLVYRARGNVWKVRAMMWLSLVVAIWFCIWGWDLFQSYGTRPADGGVLAPFGQRLAWLLFLAGFGLGFLGGMWLYGTIYVSSLRVDEQRKLLQIRTLGFIGSLGGRRRTCRLSDVIGADHHAGKFGNPGGVSVDAPWLSVRIRGRKWPLIVDVRGHFPDRKLAAKVLKLRG